MKETELIIGGICLASVIYVVYTVFHKKPKEIQMQTIEEVQDLSESIEFVK